MHHLVEPAVGAPVAPGEDTAVQYTLAHWDTVWVLVQALDASTWLL